MYDVPGYPGGPTYEVVVATIGVPPSASWQTNGAQGRWRRYYPAKGGTTAAGGLDPTA